MTIINQQNNPLITIVGCVHGNERIGVIAHEYFAEHANTFPSVQFILANEPALQGNTRFVDQDLNRSFPGTPHGSHEERLAHQLLPHLIASRFVLDLHTTTSDVTMTPILTKLNTDTRRIINLCDSQEVVLIEPPLSGASLIHHCRAGVSLEYGASYAETPEALEDLFRIIHHLIQQTPNPPTPRTVFHVNQATPSDATLPPSTRNFIYSETLEGFPFLVGEQAYPNGLLASRVSSASM